MQVAGGYTLVLPPGWAHIPLLRGTNTAVKKILDGSFAHLPRDRVAPYRFEVERRLRALVADARRSAGIGLYFPVEASEAGPLPASFVISRAAYQSAGGTVLDPAQVLAVLASQHENSRLLELDGAPAVRTERVVPPAPGSEVPHGIRRVEYTVAVPGEAGRWLVAAFGTPGAADPDGNFARLLAELFDAIMLTFRWASR
jgi:hypothetical protein